MDANRVVYRRRGQLVITGEHEGHYEVRDLASGESFTMEQVYFRKHFEAQGTIRDVAMERVEMDEPIHTEVWNKLQEQGETIQKLRNRINTVMNDMRYERKENGELRKRLAMKQKGPYRNGRKRGSRGHNG